jgi:HK97 family phage prohead protease
VAVFGVTTTTGSVFDEMIARGAFENTIQESDIRCLVNHDTNFVLRPKQSRHAETRRARHGSLV